MNEQELLSRIEWKDRHLKALAEMSVTMNSFQTHEDLMGFVAGRTKALLDAQRVSVLVWNPQTGSLNLVAEAGSQLEAPPPMHTREGVEIARKAWESKKPLLLSARNHPFTPPKAEPGLADQPVSVLFVPFEDTDEASGVIYVERPFKRNAFNEEEVSLLTLIASQTASTYRNVQLLSDMRAQLKNIHAVQEVGNLLVSTLDLDTVLSLIVRGIRDVTGAEVCSIMLWDESGESLVIRAAEGIPKRIVREARVKRGENIAGWVAQEGRPLLIRNLDEDPRFVGTAGSRYRSKSLLSVPLKARGQVLGVINVNNSTSTRIFTEEDQELLMLFANHAAIALENSRLYRELEKLAITDGLTGLANHRAFQERLVREMSRAQRFLQEISLLIIDIDHFKSINDKHGHQVGDVVLHTVAQMLQDQLRKMDFVARYGGEEFAIIMPQTRKAESVRIAERLRERVARERFVKADPDRSVTISIGVSEYPSDAIEASVLVEMADRALYVSKENGRNRVTSAGAPPLLASASSADSW
jgi:diguanylate cyclase (GGDEF)-like protein